MTNQNDLQILYNNPVYVDPKVGAWMKIQTQYRLLNLLSIYNIQELNRIATSVKLAGRPSQKKQMITDVMENRGFKRLDCGTNRLVFKYMEDQSIVVKVAFDRVAINDNLREYKNQEILRPYCTKCFEVSPCGTVGLFERVEAIVKESLDNSEVINAIFDVIYDITRNGYLLDDFGSNYYKNWGIRNIDGEKNLVILDYPYVYEPDLAKLTCNNQDPSSPTGFCGGQYEYDDGFNYIRCEKCGKVVTASEVAKTRKEKGKNGLIVEREETDMLITIEKNGKTIVLGEEKESTTYKKMSRKEYRMKKAAKELKVTIERGDHSELEEPEKPRKFVGNTNVEPVRTERLDRIDDGCRKLEVTVITGEGEEYTGKYAGYSNVYGTGAKIVRTVDGKEVEEATNYDTIEPVDEAITKIDDNEEIETVEDEEDMVTDAIPVDNSGISENLREYNNSLVDIIKHVTDHESVFDESENIEEPNEEEFAYKDSESSSINSMLSDKLKNINLNDNSDERDLDLKPRKVYCSDDDISDDILGEY